MRSMDEFLSDPDLLAEGFLHANFVWDPGGSISDGDYSLRWWRDQFYVWQDGGKKAATEPIIVCFDGDEERNGPVVGAAVLN